jgi:hypothetical protein
MDQVYKDLANDATSFMNSARNWRFPRTPTYHFYELMNPPYNSTAPFWRDRREEIFANLRAVTKKETVTFLCYCEATEASFALPMGPHTNSTYGFGFLDAKDSFLVSTKDGLVKALRALSIHDPVLYKWRERKLECTIPANRIYTFGNTKTTVLNLKPGTKFFYFEMGEQDVKD